MPNKRFAFAVIAALSLGAPVAFAQDPHAMGGGDEDDEEPGTPAGTDPHAGNPHGNAAANDMFQPPEDGTADEPSLPQGSLEIMIADPMGKPIPNTPVTLGILTNSISKGDSKKRVLQVTGPTGVARFEHLEGGSGTAYRPMVITPEGATFESTPFRMGEKTGMRAILHVYPVTSDLNEALVVAQSVLYTEIKDDRIQIQEAFKVYNFGKNAWVPKDLIVALPPEFTAFTAQQGMTDIGVEAVGTQGVRIHGTFPPGQHMVEFRWQLPYSGDSEVHFDVGMMPHMAASRIIAPASKDMTLDVPGFPPPQSTNDGQGQRALITEKQLRREDPPLKSVAVVIKGLPTEGNGKFIATFLAAGAVGIGLVLGAKKPGERDRKAERAKLLAELEELERAYKAGDVGPKTYERARRDLIDAVARTFPLEGTAVAAPKKKAKKRV